MSNLSVIILTKNEQENISDCIQSACWADEIIVYDSGSTDNTQQISEQLGAKYIEDLDWQGYGQHRINAQQHASCDWVMMLDADERITTELKHEIQNILKLNKTEIIYGVPRLTYCFGRYIRHSGWYPDYVYRIYPRNKTAYNDSQVHEKLIIPDNMRVENCRFDLHHFTYKNMNHYLVKSAHYAEIWAQAKYESGKSSNLTTAVLHGIGCFIKMYIIRLGFLDGKQGLLLALLSGHSTFVKYADLWTLGLPRK